MRTGKLSYRILGFTLVVMLIGAMLPLGALTGHSQVRAAPATIYVPDDYPTIQGAVDAASPGDTIIVRDGTYIENVRVNTSHLTIRSENGAQTTIIQAADPDEHVLDIAAEHVTVEGFTVSGATASLWRAGIALNADNSSIVNNSISRNRCGIIVNSDSNSIANNVVESNSNQGIHISNAQGNYLQSNYLNSNGDGIGLDNGHQNTIQGNTIAANSRCGITVSSSSRNSVVFNIISGSAEGVRDGSGSRNSYLANVIDGNTYGIRLHSFGAGTRSYVVSGNQIRNNQYGVYGYRVRYAFIADNYIEDNGVGVLLQGHHPTYWGWGPVYEASSNTVTRNHIANNNKGIHLGDVTKDNVLYLNNIIDNVTNVISESYRSPRNSWHSPDEVGYVYGGTAYVNYLGNYWSDYAGTDADGDGIGDTPYAIAGSVDDHYPLVQPFEKYGIVDQVKTPIARALDISGQSKVMHPNTPYTVTAKYFDPDGREDLKYCYLQLRHPDKPLTMMWYQATGHAAPWDGEEGANYIEIVNVDATPITESGLEGYELAWTFTINDQWPEVENAIDFGVQAWDDSDLKSGWKYDDTKASFQHTLFTGSRVLVTSPLTIFASSLYYPYEENDVLYATFDVTNRGDHLITLDELVLGGRVGDQIVDFPKVYNITLNPGDTYQYSGTLMLEISGLYYFFCAYYIAEPTPNEERFLDENNWNVMIEVELDGHIVGDDVDADLYRSHVITVLPKGTYLSEPYPGLWEELDGPWTKIQDGKEYEIRAVAADPAGQRLYVAVQRFKKLGLLDRYAISEDIYRLSNGTWQNISDGLPTLLVNAIAVSPSDPDVIYVGGNKRGVYKYADGGWLSLDGPKGGRWVFAYPARVLSLAVDCQDPDIVYVGTRGYGIYKRTEDGAWQNVWEALLRVQFTEIVPVLVASPDMPGVVYASARRLYYSGSIRALGVLRSPDYGASWQSIMIAGKVTLGEFPLFDHPTIANDIAVGGAASDRVYVATSSLQVKVPIFGDAGPTHVTVTVLADGLFMFDGEGDWEDKERWHQASGRNSENALPEVDPQAVVVSSDFPNMVWTSLRDEVWFSFNHGDDWFPLLKGQRIRGLALTENDDGTILYAYGATKIHVLKMSQTAIIVKPHSPVEVAAYDCTGRATGVVDGVTKEEIPSSLYCDKTVFLFAPADCYSYIARGVAEGDYGLTVGTLTGSDVFMFTAANIPTSPGAVHQYTFDWDALARGEDGVTVSVDSDGDGLFERTFTAGSELTGDQFILNTETFVDFDPNTLNLRGRGGGVVTVYIELPEGFDVHDIDISSIRLNGTVPALSWPTSIGDYNSNGVPDLMVKFDRRAIQAILDVGESVEITITGEVDGIPFMGVDTIRVIG